MRSFWERQQETFKLHLESRQNSSLLEEFTVSDPVNGPIVKATEKKILHGTLGISSGVALSLLANLGLRQRKKQPFTIDHKLVMLSIAGISPFAAHFGVSTYLLRSWDQRVAYDKFNEWLQKRV
ncbi:hypothetical protein ACS0TY_020140 [Phlomoides rotata]